MDFEWDEAKRLSNIAKHGIDFYAAIGVFESGHLLTRSDRDLEERWTALGLLEGRVVAVVFTDRGEARRVISARRARRHERQQHHARFGV